jgi:putative membrane protein
MFFPYYMGHFWWLHMLGAAVSSLFWLALIGLLIWGLVRLARGRQGVSAVGGPWQHYQVPPTQPSATEILRQRYARGEIDAVTFQQMLERLHATDPADAPDATRL